MLLPNKLYSYERSSLALMPKILRIIECQPMQAAELFKEMQPFLDDSTDFMSAMDCLYALQAVDINEDGEVFICLSR